MTHGIGFKRRFGRGAARSMLAAFMVVALLAVYAGTAVAHSSSAWLTCQSGLEVYVWAYETTDGQSNTVSVTIDGVEVANSPFTFGASFSHTWPVPPATAGHAAVVTIVAWDDPTGTEGWTRTIELNIKACEEVNQPPVTEPPVTEPPVTEPPVTQPPVTQPPTATPSGTVEAETGTPEPSGTTKVTLPPTDSVASNDQSSGPGSGLVLVLGLLAGASVAILPTSRRHNNR